MYAVLNCIVTEHDLCLVGLAAAACTLASADGLNIALTGLSLVAAGALLH
jgi:hypothetical protein